MFNGFLLRTILQSKLKALPAAEREKFAAMIEKNPELFMKIAEEIKSEMANGRSEMDAAIGVLKKHQAEFKEITRLQ